MKAREVFLGGWATALTNLVAIGSVGSDPIAKGGLVLAMRVIGWIFGVKDDGRR